MALRTRGTFSASSLGLRLGLDGEAGISEGGAGPSALLAAGAPSMRNEVGRPRTFRRTSSTRLVRVGSRQYVSSLL